MSTAFVGVYVLRHAYKVRDACVGQMQMDADLSMM